MPFFFWDITVDLGTALAAIIHGLKLVGDGIVALLQILFAIFGFYVPEILIRLVMLGLLAFTIWRYGKLIPKLTLLIIAFTAISTLLGLFSF